MRILGIDPGSNATGWGVVERAGGRVAHVAHGTLRAGRGASLSLRLAELARGIADLVALHRPDAVAVEQVFVAASPRSALVLGQARGAVLAALGAAGLPVVEYDNRLVKQSLTGTGAADKRQVERMVREFLRLERVSGPDASDALAIALCHAQAGRLAALGFALRRPRRRARGAGWVVRRAR
jgi:crossover junction endodeoxyribonuclease RuvC